MRGLVPSFPCSSALCRFSVWLILAGIAAPVLAAPSAESAETHSAADLADIGSWTSVDDTALDAARGGFTNGNGLAVSLGIDRIVSLNGEVVARTRIEIADLSNIGHISGEQARQTSEALSAIKLVQNGSANIYRADDLGATLGGIVIQNSLDNQQIRADTVIHSTVNSAGVLNAMHFHGTLQDALTRAASQR